MSKHTVHIFLILFKLLYLHILILRSPRGIICISNRGNSKSQWLSALLSDLKVEAECLSLGFYLFSYTFPYLNILLIHIVSLQYITIMFYISVHYLRSEHYVIGIAVLCSLSLQVVQRKVTRLQERGVLSSKA